MGKQARPIILLLINFYTILNSSVYGRRVLWLKEYQDCDPNVDYSAKLNITITSEENKQYLDGSLLLKSPLDNNIWSNVSVEILSGNSYTYLLSIIEKKSCEAMHKYFGEFIYDIERNAQLIPGMCPILQGTYRVHNMPLNYRKITALAHFPFGKLRITEAGYWRNNSIYTCFSVELENYSYL